MQLGSIREMSLRICKKQHDLDVTAARNMLKPTSAGNTIAPSHGRDLREVMRMEFITFACKRNELLALPRRLEPRDQKPTTQVVGSSQLSYA